MEANPIVPPPELPSVRVCGGGAAAEPMNERTVAEEVRTGAGELTVNDTFRVCEHESGAVHATMIAVW